MTKEDFENIQIGDIVIHNYMNNLHIVLAIAEDGTGHKTYNFRKKHTEYIYVPENVEFL